MKTNQRNIILGILIFLYPATANAMHIMEGFLPKEHSIGWLIAALPFLIFGAIKIQNILKDKPEYKMLLGLAAAFIFVLSALKIPSVTGSSSHATGVGLSAILFGPAVSSILSGIVLLFQALLLAHGGITTWGANVFSMGIAGAAAAWLIFRLCQALRLSTKIAVFAAASMGDLITYAVTAGQLALAFPDPADGFIAAYLKFLGIFAVTQIPLAVCEGLLSVVVYNTLADYEKQGLIKLPFKLVRSDVQ